MPNVSIEGGFSQRIPDPSHLPSSPAYLLLKHGRAVFLIACDVPMASRLKSKLTDPSRARIILGKPNMNPRREYYLCSEAYYFGVDSYRKDRGLK